VVVVAAALIVVVVGGTVGRVVTTTASAVSDGVDTTTSDVTVAAISRCWSALSLALMCPGVAGVGALESVVSESLKGRPCQGFSHQSFVAKCSICWLLAGRSLSLRWSSRSMIRRSTTGDASI
jgi:hypothetical protein